MFPSVQYILILLSLYCSIQCIFQFSSSFLSCSVSFLIYPKPTCPRHFYFAKPLVTMSTIISISRPALVDKASLTTSACERAPRWCVWAFWGHFRPGLDDCRDLAGKPPRRQSKQRLLCLRTKAASRRNLTGAVSCSTPLGRFWRTTFRSTRPMWC